MRKGTHRVLKGVEVSTVDGKVGDESSRETNGSDKSKQNTSKHERGKEREMSFKLPGILVPGTC